MFIRNIIVLDIFVLYKLILLIFKYECNKPSTAKMTVISIENVNKKKVNDEKKVFERGSSIQSDDLEDWDSRFMLRSELDDFGRSDEGWGQRGWFKPSCVPITIIFILIVLVVLLPLIDNAERVPDIRLHDWEKIKSCQSACRLSLVESIPLGMIYRNGSTPYPSTFQVWEEMIRDAKENIDIASYYWTLRDSDVCSDRYCSRPKKYPGSDEGEKIFQDLIDVGTVRKIPVRIVQQVPSQRQPNLDTQILAMKGAATVRSMNFARIMGKGILHTKLWITDKKNAYIGSANSDWRSLTQVKELGIYIQNCSCLVDDISKIFEIYWFLAKNIYIPSEWPKDFINMFNKENPLNLTTGNSTTSIYASSSPPAFCPIQRTSDIDAILDVIKKAEKFIYVAVMDYFPLIIYEHKTKYWGIIDDALRAAAVENKVEVRLLVSWWDHSRESLKYFLRSLILLSDSYPNVELSAKLFVVPKDGEQSKIPYSRVNHNKYMVTDNAALIGTSNWIGDYFTVTGGVSVIVSGQSELREQLENVFLRDWNSEFAYNLPS